MQAPHTHPRTEPAPLARFAAALGAGAGIFLLSVLLAGLAFVFLNAGRVYSGVVMAGVDISGVRRSQVGSVLEAGLSYPRNGQITLRDGTHSWTFTPGELGLSVDVGASTEAAYSVGRHGWPWTRWMERLQGPRLGVYLPAQYVFNGPTAQVQLELIARQINQPTVEASLSVNGLDVVVQPGQVGRVVDVDSTIQQLENMLATGVNGELTLVIIEQPPQILDVSEQATIAQNILSKELTLFVPRENGFGPWTLDRQTLAGMLTIERVVEGNSAKFQVGLDAAKLYDFLAPLAPGLAREAANARYIFNDDTRQLEVIQSAVTGRHLLVDESIQHINAELAKGEHNIGLVFDYTNPELHNDVTGQELGITELVSVQTTYFYGSSASRIQNIETAASRFHGLMVPPGAVFSMVENIGEISLDTGFAEALIIYGDRTIKGVGGGVCQVSTTLFRTVFYGGFPVVERYSHSYRVYYYELNQGGTVNENLAGLDATVYAPLVDFKFENDTPYWLLMEVYVNPAARSITWKFYSTSDGRQVSWDTSGLQNVVDPPKPVYEEDEELAKGEIEQVDWAVEGADVTVTRTVTRDGQVLFTDTITTHYSPWATVCKYGPGTKDYPPKENKQDTYSCKKAP